MNFHFQSLGWKELFDILGNEFICSLVVRSMRKLKPHICVSTTVAEMYNQLVQAHNELEVSTALI